MDTADRHVTLWQRWQIDAVHLGGTLDRDSVVVRPLFGTPDPSV